MISKLSFLDQFCQIGEIDNEVRDIAKNMIKHCTTKKFFSLKQKKQFLDEIPSMIKYKIANSMFHDIDKKLLFF